MQPRLGMRQPSGRLLQSAHEARAGTCPPAPLCLRVAAPGHAADVCHSPQHHQRFRNHRRRVEIRIKSVPAVRRPLRLLHDPGHCIPFVCIHTSQQVVLSCCRQRGAAAASYAAIAAPAPDAGVAGQRGPPFTGNKRLGRRTRPQQAARADRENRHVGHAGEQLPPRVQLLVPNTAVNCGLSPLPEVHAAWSFAFAHVATQHEA